MSAVQGGQNFVLDFRKIEVNEDNEVVFFGFSGSLNEIASARVSLFKGREASC